MSTFGDKPFKTVTIDGKSVKVHLDTDTGEFGAHVTGDGHWLTADTLVGLTSKLIRALRVASVRLALPASLLHEGGSSWRSRNRSATVESVTVTGLHATHHKVLLTRANGQKEQLGYDSELARRLPLLEAAEYIRLANAKHAAESAFEKFRANVRITDAEKWVKGELAKAATAQGTPIPAGEEDD